MKLKDVDLTKAPEWATAVGSNHSMNKDLLYWMGHDNFLSVASDAQLTPRNYGKSKNSLSHFNNFHSLLNLEPVSVKPEPKKIEPEIKVSRYHRLVQSQMPPVYDDEGNFLGIMCDFYDIAAAYDPENRNAAEDHALKKMLLPGKRGTKGVIKDIGEAIWSLQAGLRMRLKEAAKEAWEKQNEK